MKTKHTKGEWLFESHVVFTEESDVAYVYNDNISLEEIHANGRLIAVAPKMLEALQMFVNRVEKGEIRSKKTYAQFKEIIKKATS